MFTPPYLCLLSGLCGAGHTGFNCLFHVTLDVALTDRPSPAVTGRCSYVGSEEVPVPGPLTREGCLSVCPAAAGPGGEGLAGTARQFALQKPQPSESGED